MSTVGELLQNIVSLEAKLGSFETQFGVKSKDFYTAMLRGDLEAFDALDEYRMVFIKWLALYKTWLSFDQKYQQLIMRQPVALQIKTHLELAHA